MFNTISFQKQEKLDEKQMAFSGKVFFMFFSSKFKITKTKIIQAYAHICNSCSINDFFIK